MTSFFEHQKLSFRKNYMRNLIQLASADGHLDESEKVVLFEIAKKRNLKDWQVEELLNAPEQVDVFIPESFLNKMNLLFDLMRLVHADGVVSFAEVAYVRYMLASFGLSPEIMNELLDMFEHGTPSHDVWREFTESLVVETKPRFVTIL